MRDKDNKDYLGKGVLKAVENINGPISNALKNIDIIDQAKIDKILIDLDGTDQKKNLVQMQFLRYQLPRLKVSIRKKDSIFKYLGGSSANQLTYTNDEYY